MGNASRLLQRLGIDLTDVTNEPPAFEVRSWQDGGLIWSHPIGERYRQDVGAPMLTLHRATLQRFLAAAVPPEHISLGHRLVRLSDEPAGMRLPPPGLDKVLEPRAGHCGSGARHLRGILLGLPHPRPRAQHRRGHEFLGPRRSATSAPMELRPGSAPRRCRACSPSPSGPGRGPGDRRRIRPRRAGRRERAAGIRPAFRDLRESPQAPGLAGPGLFTGRRTGLQAHGRCGGQTRCELGVAAGANRLDSPAQPGRAGEFRISGRLR